MAVPHCGQGWSGAGSVDIGQNGFMSDLNSARSIADRYVTELAELDPLISTRLGLRPDEDRLPDYSPDGHEAQMSLIRSTLAELAAAPAPPIRTTSAAPGC